MNIELITGAAGSGKTRACIDEYRTLLDAGEGKNTVFLLPTEEAVKRVVNELLKGERPGLFASRIMTFRRLVEWILEGDETQPVATPAIREMLIKGIVAGLEAAGELAALAPVAGERGTPKVIGDFIAELKLGGITPDGFERMLHKKGVTRKDREVARIYRIYEKRLLANGMIDEPARYLLAGDRVKEKRWDVGGFAALFVDGFESFTPVQLDIIAMLARRSRRTVITLQYDAERSSVFEAVKGTYDTICARGGVRERRCARQGGDNALSHLKRHLFDDDAFRVDLHPGDESVRVTVAPRESDEIRSVAREIKRFLMTEEARMDDICVLFRDLRNRASILREEFRRFGIPLRLMKGEPVGCNPLVRSMRAVLEVVAGGWKSDDLLRVVSSGYHDFNLLRVALDIPLRHATAVSYGSAYWLRLSEEAESVPGGITENPAFSGASIFTDGRKNLGVAASCRKLIGLLSGCETAASLSEWCRRCRGLLGNLDGVRKSIKTASRVEDFWMGRRDLKAVERLEKILDEMGRAGNAIDEGNSLLSPGEFLELFDLELESAVYHFDEPMGRGVTVMEANSVRPLTFPVVFIGGLQEKAFPVSSVQDPLYPDEERRHLNRLSAGVLQERSSRSMMERHLFYAAVTRARKRLFLSYARADALGKEKRPSHFLDEVENLFIPGRLRREADNEDEFPRGIAGIWSRDDLFAAMVRGKGRKPSARSGPPDGFTRIMERRLRHEQDETYCHARQMLNVERERSHGRRVSLYDGNLSGRGIHDALRTIFPADAIFSVTRLNAYGRCPFVFFLRHVLGIRPFEEVADEVLPLRKGELVHRLLRVFFNALRERGTRIPDLGVEQSRAIMEEIRKECLDEYEKTFVSMMPPFWKLQREELRLMLDDFLEAEYEWQQEGEIVLEPSCFELAFGLGDKSGSEHDGRSIAEPYVTKSGVPIRGSIDRIDIALDGGFCVVDYKLGEGYDWSDALEGIDLQIPLYLMAAAEIMGRSGPARPVGGYYLSMKDFSRRKGMWRNEYNGRYYRMSTRCKAVVEKETWKRVMEAVDGFCASYVTRIRKGEFALLPASCPDYCEYAPVCRYNEWRMGRKKRVGGV